MSDSDIELDSDGCEVRSDDSQTTGSLADFISDDSEYTDGDADWFPPPTDKKRVSVKPVLFAQEVFDSTEEEEDY